MSLRRQKILRGRIKKGYGSKGVEKIKTWETFLITVEQMRQVQTAYEESHMPDVKRYKETLELKIDKTITEYYERKQKRQQIDLF